MTSNDKPQSAPRRSRCTTDATDGSSLCLRTNCSANTVDSLLPPCVTRVRHIGHYGRDRRPMAARSQDVTEQRVVLAKPREIHEQLLSCRALGRRADIDDDQTRQQSSCSWISRGF